MKVLLVEDEALVRRFIRSLIDWEANGFTIAGEASNGEEAWTFLEQQPVDIVLTDIRMPVMNGFDLIERISRDDLRCEIVILSSYDDFDYVRTALKLQVSDYVYKATISENELISCLRKARADWAKRQEQIIVDRMHGLNLRDRKEVVGAYLLRAALEPDADDSYLSRISEQLGIWNTSFEAALVFAGEDERIVLSAAAAGGAVAVACEGNRWIVAAPQLNLPLEEEEGLIVVAADQPFPLRAWPEKYASLAALLEQRQQDAANIRSYHGSIRKAVEYLQSNYMDEITLEVMSELVHVSPAYFSRLFMKETGRTFTDYLTSLRLSHAKSLLLGTALPVYDIAERVGYKNAKYFLKLFKESTGWTPTEYRQRKSQE